MWSFRVRYALAMLDDSKLTGGRSKSKHTEIDGRNLQK
jgi:hypothetical protein